MQNLDTFARRFSIGGYTVDYGQATVTGGTRAQPLANGVLVRVRANPIGTGQLVASWVQWWYPTPGADGAALQSPAW